MFQSRTHIFSAYLLLILSWSAILAHGSVYYHSRPIYAPVRYRTQYLPSRTVTTADPPSRPNAGQAATTNQPEGARDATDQARCAAILSGVERQLLHYMSNIDVLTGSIQELDEAVQQLGVRETTQDTTTISEVESFTDEPRRPKLGPNVHGGNSVRQAIRQKPTESPDYPTTESFTDEPDTLARNFDAERPTSVSGISRPTDARSSDFYGFNVRKRDASASSLFGQPQPANQRDGSHDQAGEDLQKAANDLRELRKDLSATAEWLRQTNHTIHSVMLRALQAYVMSIERRVDQQRQLHAQTRSFGLKPKIAAIKDKIANLVDKLKALVPFKSIHLSRDDIFGSPLRPNSFAGIPLPGLPLASGLGSSSTVVPPTLTANNGVVSSPLGSLMLNN